jgi:hypothetical protein
MGLLEQILAQVDNAKRIAGRNAQDLISSPSAYADKIVGHLRNSNAGVSPTIAGGELTNRPMTRDEITEKYVGGATDTLSGGLGIVKNYVPKAVGPALKAKSFEAEDLNALRNLVQDYTKPRMLSPDRASALQRALQDAEIPGTKTNVLMSEFDEPLSLYTRMSGDDLGLPHEYLSNLVAIGGQPGVGRQALQDVAHQAPVSLISTPGSKGFYDKLIAEGFPGLQARDNSMYELAAFTAALRNKK